MMSWNFHVFMEHPQMYRDSSLDSMKRQEPMTPFQIVQRDENVKTVHSQDDKIFFLKLPSQLWEQVRTAHTDTI